MAPNGYRYMDKPEDYQAIEEVAVQDQHAVGMHITQLEKCVSRLDETTEGLCERLAPITSQHAGEENEQCTGGVEVYGSSPICRSLEQVARRIEVAETKLRELVRYVEV